MYISFFHYHTESLFYGWDVQLLDDTLPSLLDLKNRLFLLNVDESGQLLEPLLIVIPIEELNDTLD